MKKRLLLIIIFLFIFGCNSYFTGRVVQQTTTTEYRTVLVNSIVNYLTNPNNAILNVNEIKDLLFGYFSTHNNIIDLSIIGTYSHESLIDIYNKAKGTNVPEGKWYDIINSPSTYKMDKETGGFHDGVWMRSGMGYGYGCWPQLGVCSPDMVYIQPGQTLYFYMDPLNYARISEKTLKDYYEGTYGSGYPALDYLIHNRLYFIIIDYNQAHGANLYGTRVIVVDRNGNEITIYHDCLLCGTSNGVYQGDVKLLNHTDEKTYLLEIHSYLNEPAYLRVNFH